MRVTLIADSGATKCEWCLLVDGKKKKTIITDGLSPYFLTADQITALLQMHLLPKIKNFTPKNIFFYGTGLANPANAKVINRVLKKIFTKAKIEINHDLTAAARALCGKQKGIACILGTGANAGYYNGKKIAKNSPGLGYILGDEGSGAYLGKKVVQYYLYQTFDEELMARFNKRFNTNKDEILNKVYKLSLIHI
jgi:glucosamine kinase